MASPLKFQATKAFFVSDVRGRSVSIGQPDDVPCVAYEDKGIECDYEQNISRLRLTTAASVLHNLERTVLMPRRALSASPKQTHLTFFAGRFSSDNAPEPSEGNARRFQPPPY